MNLALNSSKARSDLGCKEEYVFEESVKRTSDWFKAVNEGRSKEVATLEDISDFLNDMK